MIRFPHRLPLIHKMDATLKSKSRKIIVLILVIIAVASKRIDYDIFQNLMRETLGRDVVISYNINMTR